jgi:hypothetical protein
MLAGNEIDKTSYTMLWNIKEHLDGVGYENLCEEYEHCLLNIKMYRCMLLQKLY